jgi:hypothetical protein
VGVQTAPSIRITITTAPDPATYARAVLGCQAVLAMLGLDAIATVWQDTTVATDQDLAEMVDRWAERNPWC